MRPAERIAWVLEHGGPGMRRLFDAYATLTGLSDPYQSPQHDRARPTSRAYPIPGAPSRIWRERLELIDRDCDRLSERAQAALGDPVEAHGDRCMGCGRVRRTAAWRLVDQVAAHLEGLLAGGPRPITEVSSEVMMRLKCSPRTVRAASKQLGVVLVTVDGQRCWEFQNGGGGV